jgi:hypothetical protein
MGYGGMMWVPVPFFGMTSDLTSISQATRLDTFSFGFSCSQYGRVAVCSAIRWGCGKT